MSEPDKKEVRGCGGTLRIVTRELAPEEVPWPATGGQTAHAVCEHPDGTVFAYPGIPTPGEQLAHEFPGLDDVDRDHERHHMSDPTDATPEPENGWETLGAMFIAVMAEIEGGGQETRGAIPFAVEGRGAQRRALFPIVDSDEPKVVAEWTDGDPESVKVHDLVEVPEPVREAIHSQLTDIARGEEPEPVDVINWGRPLEHVRRLRRLYYAAELATRAGGELLGELNSDINGAAHDLYDAFATRLVELGPVAAPGAQALAKLRRASVERARIDAALDALAAVPTEPRLTSAVVHRRERLMHKHAEAEAIEHDAIRTLTLALASTE